jgi:hypothetical protein
MQRLTRTNRVLATNPRGKWSSESLEAAMDVVEKGITSLRRGSKFWGIPITSLFDHLYAGHFKFGITARNAESCRN